MKIVLFLFACVAQVSAQTEVTDDARVTGVMGAGTLMPTASLTVGMQPEDSFALKVSSPDGSSLFLLDRSAKAGLGQTPTSARLDLAGRGDASETALELGSGNSTSSVSSAQIAFASADGRYRHNMRSRATGNQNERESLDFYLWTSSDAESSLGSSFVMSLQSSATASQAGLHVSPTGATAGAQLVVSSGTSYAGGIILGYAAGAPCFGELKRDISRMGDAEREGAVRDLLALRPSSFRYRNDSQERRGFIYEEAPSSIQNGHGAIVLDERLLNLELALQAARGRVEKLEAELDRLEGRR